MTLELYPEKRAKVILKTEYTHSLYVSSDVLVVPGAVGDNPVAEHLPDGHPVGPHVPGRRVVTVLDSFWGHPPYRYCSSVLRGQVS